MRISPVALTVAPAVTPIVRPAAIAVDGVTVRADDPALVRAMAAAAAAARVAADRADVIAAVRAMYRRVGIDPTKTRPSSEALLRRVRKGDALPCINTIVDVVNWCSLESQLPFGLYDRDAIRGEVTLRLGAPGERYPGIRKDDVHLEDRLTLADVDGPFGNPTSDSARTMVTLQTRHVLVVIFAPTALPSNDVQRALDLTMERLRRYGDAAADRDTAGAPDR